MRQRARGSRDVSPSMSLRRFDGFGLTEDEAAVMHRIYGEHRTLSETAAEIGCSVSEVNVLVTSALNKAADRQRDGTASDEAANLDVDDAASG
jgi:hypothetical protein